MLLNNTVSRLIQRVEKSIIEPCHLCGGRSNHSTMLCSACDDDLPSYQHRCEICAIPLPKLQYSLCGQCLAHRPAFDRVYSPYLYQAPVTNLIHQLKYQHQLHSLRLLGKLMSDYLQDQMQTMPDILIPVPLHRKRLKERGFNQASELALRIKNAMGIPVDNHLITRKKHTEAQTGLKPRQRKSNLAGAFKINKKFIPQSILIVDDVMTTGATAAELAKCLKRGGAKSVEVITLARADRR